MDAQIALVLLTDGIANGAIYVLIALGTVLIFSVTRVIFVPFGDIAALTTLTVATLQLGRLPGTVWLVMVLTAIAATMELVLLLRRRQPRRIPAALAGSARLPVPPVRGSAAALPRRPVAATAALTAAGAKLALPAQMLLALLLVLPVAPLLNRIVFQPMANASVLVLLIVAVALHFALSGLVLLFFGPEG